MDAQADLSLGAQSFCWFCHEVAHIFQNKVTLRQYAALLTFHDIVVLIDENRPTIVSS